jgi:rubrerythrin
MTVKKREANTAESIPEIPSSITCKHCGDEITEVKYIERGEFVLSGIDKGYVSEGLEFHCPNCREPLNMEDLSKSFQEKIAESNVVLPDKCPICKHELTLTEHPDTGTSVDFYEGQCKNGHMFIISVENQTNEVTISPVESE